MTVQVSKQTAYVVLLNPALAVSKQTAYIVLLPTPPTTQASISFSANLSLAIASGTPGGVVITASLLFKMGLGLTLDGRQFPHFSCDRPAAKTWDRVTVAPKTWDCAVITPAEECDGLEETDDLDLVSGDRLVTLAGYGLKLVS